MMLAFGNSPEKHMPNKLPMPHPRPSCYAPPPTTHRKLDKGRPRTAFTCADPARLRTRWRKTRMRKECTFTTWLRSARLTGPRQSCLAMPRARSPARIKSRGLSSRLVSRRPRDGPQAPSEGRPPRSAARRPSRRGVPHKGSIRPSRKGAD